MPSSYFIESAIEQLLVYRKEVPVRYLCQT